MERLDFIFSYWIYAWYLLFWFKIIDTYNPKFAIILGIVENLAILFLMFYYKTKVKLRILFFIMMMILKLIPIYTIWNEKITRKDIIATFILFMIYLAWILLNKKSIFEITEKTKRMIIDNKNILPGMVFIEKLGI